MALFGGHAHLSFMFANAQVNFSHRIDHFSFGDMKSGLVNALDGTEKVTSDSSKFVMYTMLFLFDFCVVYCILMLKFTILRLSIHLNFFSMKSFALCNKTYHF